VQTPQAPLGKFVGLVWQLTSHRSASHQAIAAPLVRLLQALHDCPRYEINLLIGRLAASTFDYALP
jgi:hypothetical protein